MIFYLEFLESRLQLTAEKKIKASGDDGEFDETEEEMTTENMANQEKRKKFMMSQIDCSQPTDLNFRYLTETDIFKILDFLIDNI
jgi:acetyl-CoA carboxylase beta subunit